MLIEQVRKKTPLARLLYWIGERDHIRELKAAGKPKPWSNDTIMQATYFTNVHREDDKVTAWYRDNIRALLENDPAVLFATIAFRWFNYIPTGVILANYRHPVGDQFALGFFERWVTLAAIKELNRWKEEGNQIFTGAFNISNSGSTKPKINRVCEDYIQPVWENRIQLTAAVMGSRLEDAHNLIRRQPGLGGSGFMAAQIIADLKYTYLLKDAHDWWTWCCLGPGSKRGLNRVLQRDPDAPTPKDWKQRIADLQAAVNGFGFKLHAQDMQNCLCEYDKYVRVLQGEGRSKRTYPGV
jgi:hypothetical protein